MDDIYYISRRTLFIVFTTLVSANFNVFAEQVNQDVPGNNNIVIGNNHGPITIITNNKIDDHPSPNNAVFLKKSTNIRYIEYNNGIILDKKTNLMWPTDNLLEKSNFNSAIKLSNNYQNGGFSDWRLPSLYELERINESKKLKEFSKLEVWATASDGKPASFNFEFEDKYSDISENISRYILPIRKPNQLK